MAQGSSSPWSDAELRPYIPIAILLFAFTIAMIADTASLMRARGELVSDYAQQDPAYRNAVALRDRLDAIAQDTSTLAAGGDPAAKAIVDALRQQGITLPPPKP